MFPKGTSRFLRERTVPLVDDRAMIQATNDGVRLEGLGLSADYYVELTRDECQLIADLIRRVLPSWPDCTE
jgi:hypothetical protein